MTKKTETKKSTYTLSEITEMVAAIFEQYDYRIRMERASVTHKNGYVKVSFGEMDARGMASFSQDKITPSFEVYHEVAGSTAGSGNTPNLAPWELWNLIWDAELGIRLTVDYEHYGGGRNGFSRRYTPKHDKVKGSYLSLLRD